MPQVNVSVLLLGCLGINASRSSKHYSDKGIVAALVAIQLLALKLTFLLTTLFSIIMHFVK